MKNSLTQVIFGIVVIAIILASSFTLGYKTAIHDAQLIEVTDSGYVIAFDNNCYYKAN